MSETKEVSKIKGLLPTPDSSKMISPKSSLRTSYFTTIPSTKKAPEFLSIHDIGYPLYSNRDMLFRDREGFKSGYEDYFSSDNESELTAKFLFMALKDSLIQNIFLPMSTLLKHNNFFPLFEGSFFLHL